MWVSTGLLVLTGSDGRRDAGFVWRGHFKGVYFLGAKQNYRLVSVFKGKVKIRAKKGE